MKPMSLPLLVLVLLGVGGCHPFEAIDGTPFPQDDTLDMSADADVNPGDLVRDAPDATVDVDLDTDAQPDVPGDSGCTCPDIAIQHGDYTCNAENICVVKCDTGFEDCDEDPLTCEAKLRDDPINCGACGNSCIGECIDGSCQCTVAAGDQPCPFGKGWVCCEDGLCAPDQNACAGCQQDCEVMGLDCCDNNCIDLDNSLDNCGGCNLPCREGQNELTASCDEGVCQRECVPGFEICRIDQGCIELKTDENCGACGNTCTGDLTCLELSNGTYGCGCSGNDVACGDNCVSANDPTFCGKTCITAVNCGAGSCNNFACICPPSDACNPGETCDPTWGCVCNGNTACASGMACCGNDCVTLEYDADNCGECGVVCQPGHACCEGGCVDVSTNLRNCGACGNNCGMGNTCVGGFCTSIMMP